MKISTYALALLLAGATTQSMAHNGVPRGAARPTFEMPKGAEYMPNKVIFKVKNDYRSQCSTNQVNINTLNNLLNALGSHRVSKKFPTHQPVGGRNQYGKPYADLSLIYEVSFEQNINLTNTINEILATGLVAYAEPHYIFRPVYTPNDANIGSQSYLNNIKAREAWDITKGDTAVLIAIVDSGVKWDHPDLNGNIQRNHADNTNDNLDNDGNGKVNDYVGWDLAGADYNANPLVEDNNPTVTGGNNGHGTHVAGLASAATDNTTGMAGVGFKCRLLAVKCSADNDTRANGQGYILAGYEGIVYSADRGADVINCSWGGPGSGGGYGQDIIDYASINKGSAVVAAAGNDNSPADFYPAYYDGVISVAATTNTDRKSSFSNYNFSVTVSAPGSNIYSTLWSNNYGQMSGTSMASPIVAGAIGLLKAKYPTYTPAQLKALIRATCDDIYSLTGNNSAALAGKLGKGRINIFRGLTELMPAVKSNQLTFIDSDNNILPGDTVWLDGSFINLLNPSSANLKATLTTTNTNVTIVPTTSVKTLGVMATGETKALTSPYKIFIKPTIPLNTNIDFKITYSDGTYSDFEFISLNANADYVNVEKNNISTSVGSLGRLGFMDSDASIGLGFQYKKENMLYEMSLITGVAADSISNCARGANSAAAWDEDFSTMSRATAINPSILSVYDVNASFTDDVSTTNMGLEITQNSYVWTTPNDSNYVMVVYDVKNSTANNYNNFHLGLYADWDVSAGGTADKAKWSAPEKLGYIYNTEVGGLFAGVVALSSANPHYYAFKNDGADGGFGVYDGYSDTEKFSSISGVIKDSAGTADVSMAIGSGPYMLMAGQTARVAFALVGGENLEMIKAAAVAAQTKYNDNFVITSVRGSVANTLKTNIWPNPTRNTLHISVKQTAGETTNVMIYDAVGKQVHASSIQGENATINTNHLKSGIYTVKMNNQNGTSVQKLVVE